jgi:predicted pyridoxine 5'-phosphate oxidase superfamily flavin-nucleotide-binding protein
MTEAAFHEGEISVQQRVDGALSQRLAEIGPQVIRHFMPGQHQEFFEQLPFVIAGSVDVEGQPWASVLTGPPGFMRSPDPRYLAIGALAAPHDPLAANLKEGAAIGLLGIEPHTRRRNRMNGVVRRMATDGFMVEVSQSFGNCPKYIQARQAQYTGPRDAGLSEELAALDDDAVALIRASDTFFIATSFGSAGDAAASGSDVEASHGVDVSHRGGKQGFVRVDGNDTLVVPDFSGNFFFNTLGNISVNPRAGLLFIDFASGDLLHVAAQASIVWDGAELAAFQGAKRLLRLRVTSMRRVRSAMALSFGEGQLSPALNGTGQW